MLILNQALLEGKEVVISEKQMLMGKTKAAEEMVRRMGNSG